MSEPSNEYGVFGDVLSSAAIGSWKIEIDEGCEPRMYDDRTMKRLVCLPPDIEMSPEALYHAWYDRIHPDHYDQVSAGVDCMIKGKHAEIQYPWIAPDGREIIVRCGGVRDFRYKKGIRVAGIHQWVTELQHFERANEARHATSDQILSSITQQLYGYNITVDLVDGSFSLIPGTGAEQELALMADAKDYREIYSKLLERLRPDHRDRFRELCSLDYLRANQGHTGFFRTEEYCTLGEGDDARWREVTVIFGADANGHPIANLLGRDITERHREKSRHELEVKAVQSRDQILSGITKTLYGFNVTVNLRDGSFSLITGTGIELICAVFESCLGKSYDNAVDILIAHVPQDHRDEALRTIGRDFLLGLRGQSGHVGTTEIPWHGSDGLDHWVEINRFMATDEQGDPIVNLLGRDVTERHVRQAQREREREAATAKDRVLSEITQQLYGFNLTVNLNTLRYTFIAGTGLERLCHDFEETDDYNASMARLLSIVVPEDRDRIAELVDAGTLRRLHAAGRRGSRGAIQYAVNSDGRRQWRELNLFLASDANGEPIANILGRNITEQRTRADAEAQLLVARQANEAKTAFLFNMSHDIRTPMNAIMGFSEIAMKNLRNEDKVRDCLRKAQEAGELLLSLINSVLDMSRIEAGKAQLEEAVGDVKLSFANIESTMQALAASRDITLTYEFGDIPDRYVYVDYERCSRVFVNLISNAIKYTRPGGWVKVRCEEVGAGGRSKVEGGTKDDENLCSTSNLQPSTSTSTSISTSNFDSRVAHYRYTFEDNGIGMSEEFQKHVFEEFAREQNSTTSGVQGTGLGLPLCRSLVDLMGGTIEFRSRQGVGTKFTVTLPFRLQEGAEYIDPVTGVLKSATEPETPALPKGYFKGCRALLVEDNELNREVATYVLEEQGILVDTAVNGKEALEKVKGCAYDFILMDIQMPVMDGYEATRILREDGYTRPILALSANAFAEDRAGSLAAGMDDHIAKPIKVPELLACLARYVPRREN